jgi:hypothetical protein
MKTLLALVNAHILSYFFLKDNITLTTSIGRIRTVACIGLNNVQLYFSGLFSIMK